MKEWVENTAIEWLIWFSILNVPVNKSLFWLRQMFYQYAHTKTIEA